MNLDGLGSLSGEQAKKSSDIVFSWAIAASDTNSVWKKD